MKYLKFNLIFVILAIIIGLVATVFAKICEFGFSNFIKIEHFLGYWVIVYIPIMLLVAVYLLRNYFPEAEGSGIPQVLAISQNLSIKNINKIFNPRLIITKIGLVFVGTLAGATIGREGPTIHIGATIMDLIGKKYSLERRKILLLTGAAAGLASAFNTPIGGIIFAYEELIKGSQLKFSILKICAIAISGIVSISIVGNYSYFGRVDRYLLFYQDKIFVVAIVIGGITALLSMGFTRLVKIFILNNNPVVRWRHNNPYKNTVLCGIIIAIAGLLSKGLSFGNGYRESVAVLSGSIHLPANYVFYKSLSSIFSTSSGVPGGYFATSLAIGSGIGSFVYHIFSLGNLQQYCLLGMVGFLAALLRAPATAIIMVLQISSTQIFALPLIVSALVATLVANLDGQGIYEYQMQKLIQT